MNMDIEAARRQMIDQQVRTWEVLDSRVLEILASVPREQFVPAAYRELAFADVAIPLGHDQRMLSPKTEGRFLQALEVQPTDQILVVGDGTGYLTACLAKLGKQVRAIEFFGEVAAQARHNLQAAAINNAVVEEGDAMRLDINAAYDAIAVVGSLPIYDARFQRALKIGGRLIVVTGVAPAMEAVKVTRLSDNEWRRESLFETELPALINATKPSAFVF